MKKIVIEIPDETYNECLADEGRLNIIWELVDAIRKGTPLPKGHGRILDEKTGKAKAVYWYERYKHICNDIQECQFEDIGESEE